MKAKIRIIKKINDYPGYDNLIFQVIEDTSKLKNRLNQDLYPIFTFTWQRGGKDLDNKKIEKWYAFNINITCGSSLKVNLAAKYMNFLNKLDLLSEYSWGPDPVIIFNALHSDEYFYYEGSFLPLSYNGKREYFIFRETSSEKEIYSRFYAFSNTEARKIFDNWIKTRSLSYYSYNFEPTEKILNFSPLLPDLNN